VLLLGIIFQELSKMESNKFENINIFKPVAKLPVAFCIFRVSGKNCKIKE